MRHLFVLIAILSIVGLAACAPAAPTPTLTPVPDTASAETEEATEPAAQATEDVTEAPTEEATEPVEDPFTTTADGDAFFISVNRISAMADAPGQLIVDASLSNQTEADVQVEAAQLTLFDTDSNAYSPDETPENVNPALPGAQLAPQETLRGFVLFTLPDGAMPGWFRWCLDDTCEVRLVQPVDGMLSE